MKYLNGIIDEISVEPKPLSDLWKQLPEPVDSQLLSAIDSRIAHMNQKYNLFIRRNRILSVINLLETELKEIDYEIKRI